MRIHDIDQNTSKEEIVGISYSGGGNRGVAHIGVLRAFLERKIIPSHIAGVSAGAFIAAFHAYDPHTFNSFTDLKILFSYINKQFIGLNIFQIIGHLLRGGVNTKSLGHSTHVEKFLDERLPFRSFSDLKVPLLIGSTNVTEGKDVWFRQGPIIPALMASSATPGIFPPVQIGGDVYIDGGVSENLPLFELSKEKCGVIYAVNAGYSGGIKRPPKNFIENLINARDIAQFQTTHYEVELIKALYPKIKIIPIFPSATMDLAPYDFTPEKTNAVLEESYEQAMKVLEEKN